MKKNTTVPDSAMFTMEEYLTEREMSDLPVLLVEGPDDSKFFQILRDELLKKMYVDDPIQVKVLLNIEIDTPEIIKSPQGEVLGNRHKVEYACKMADNTGFKSLLVGFVDREFREFDISHCISDCIEAQNELGRVIWSRGHSIENYLFEFEILRDALRDYGISSSYPIQDVLDLFQLNFKKIISISCAISLAARDIELIKLAESSIDTAAFVFENHHEINFDVQKWDYFLSKKTKLDESRRVHLLQKFDQYLKIVDESEFETVKWICHGHIGMIATWTAFEACIVQICTAKNIVDIGRNKKIDQAEKFIRSSSHWIRESVCELNKFDTTPIRCFQMLGFTSVGSSTGIVR